jgi:hypothetical protein
LKLQKVQKVKRAMMKNGSHMLVFAVKAKEPLPKAKKAVRQKEST